MSVKSGSSSSEPSTSPSALRPFGVGTAVVSSSSSSLHWLRNVVGGKERDRSRANYCWFLLGLCFRTMINIHYGPGSMKLLTLSSPGCPSAVPRPIKRAKRPAPEQRIGRPRKYARAWWRQRRRMRRMSRSCQERTPDGDVTSPHKRVRAYHPAGSDLPHGGRIASRRSSQVYTRG